MVGDEGWLDKLFVYILNIDNFQVKKENIKGFFRYFVCAFKDVIMLGKN